MRQKKKNYSLNKRDEIWLMKRLEREKTGKLGRDKKITR